MESPVLVAALISPALAEDLAYKDYAKASEAWRRGFVFAISQYMSAVAQPDEESPYPVRTALKRCLGASTDSVLARRVEAYVSANPGISNTPMSTLVLAIGRNDIAAGFIRLTRPPERAETAGSQSQAPWQPVG
jgi:hypothetical protein